jgi:diadenosine tetraphosphate (Ap4A) HIT family hydrolase
VLHVVFLKHKNNASDPHSLFTTHKEVYQLHAVDSVELSACVWLIQAITSNNTKTILLVFFILFFRKRKEVK